MLRLKILILIIDLINHSLLAKLKKNLRSRLESIWHTNKTSNRDAYKCQAKGMANLITAANNLISKMLF